jgi:hypothetical protein
VERQEVRLRSRADRIKRIEGFMVSPEYVLILYPMTVKIKAQKPPVFPRILG